MLDLYVGYDERGIAETSRDLTTFQTPFGTMRLVTLPMGWTNSVPIFHDDVTHILQPEIPDVTIPYIDDVAIRGPPDKYILPDGSEERIADNSGIRRFIWEHFQNLNCVVQRIKYSGGTLISQVASKRRNRQSSATEASLMEVTVSAARCLAESCPKSERSAIRPRSDRRSCTINSTTI